MQNKQISLKYKSAEVSWKNSELFVTTGRVSRTWKLTPEGFATINLSEIPSGLNWKQQTPECDWFIRGYHETSRKAVLKDISVHEVTDHPLASDCLTAEAEFEYPAARLGLRFTVTLFPGAPGIRTQLSLRLLEEAEEHEVPSALEGSVCDALPVKPGTFRRKAAGYYNDTQHRNRDDTPILREVENTGPIKKREIYDWANLLILSGNDNSGGIILVKESHKCVNQPGLDTGEFILDPDKIRITGLGLNNVSWNWYNRQSRPPVEREYKNCWASWIVLFSGGEDEAELALKQFDRFRFPPQPEKDFLIRSNTWGTRFEPGRGARIAAREDNILREIDSCSEIGIELLTIDDGWDKALPDSAVEPKANYPSPERFPGGWRTVREHAVSRDVKLGLHFPVNTPLTPLIENYREGGFSAYKLDFGNYLTREELDRITRKAEQLSEAADHNLRISWDLTENYSRMGYYVGREYGTLFPANRREVHLERLRHAAYIPRLVFRDAWHFARYLNLNQIETTIQNRDRMDPEYSNAARYSHSYIAGITLMAQPLFFLETQFYSTEAKQELARLLSLYKQHRDRICRGFVFPIGDEPDDRSWSGFQSHDPETGTGYVTLFREADNRDEEKEITLHFKGNQQLSIENLISGNREIYTPVSGKKYRFRIKAAPSFLFLRYEEAGN